jgi:hypothetical protein
VSDVDPDPWDQLDAAWSERFEGLAEVVDKVVALQQELVSALGELQEDLFSLSPAEPASRPPGAAAREGLQAQARESHQRAARLIERAAELTADAQRLRREAAALAGQRTRAAEDP